MKQSAIGWTDYSGGALNFASGCTPVSEGCANCYARAIYERFGRDFSKVVWSQDKLDRAMRANYGDYSPKRGAPHKPMCFVCDTGDLFHEDVPDGFLLTAWKLMASRKDVIWQVLTKRPERARDFFNTYGYQHQIGGEPQIWLGVTAENQARADEQIPILLDIPAAVRFVSVEPMLEMVDLSKAMPCSDCGGSGYITWGYMEGEFCGCNGWLGVEWVICGAESGPRRRLFDVAWAEALYQQCKAAGVPFFAKQDGALRPGAPLVLSDGIVQQWPEV